MALHQNFRSEKESRVMLLSSLHNLLDTQTLKTLNHGITQSWKQRKL